MLQLYSNIRKRRKELKMTQTDLALETGYADKSMIARIEQGKVDLPISKIKEFARALKMDSSTLVGDDGVEPSDSTSSSCPSKMVKIPILGTVAAGIPIYAIEDILGYVEMPEWRVRSGEYFALQIKGNSMHPDIQNGDLVIARSQPVADNNDIVIATVNGDEATCKRFRRYATELCLVSINPEFETMRFTPQEVNELPVAILGKVVEIRRKLE